MNTLSLYISFNFVILCCSITRTLTQNSYGLKRPQHCSQCATNPRLKNYACCFHFYRCCTEAKRKQTTESPQMTNTPEFISTTQSNLIHPDTTVSIFENITPADKDHLDGKPSYQSRKRCAPNCYKESSYSYRDRNRIIPRSKGSYEFEDDEWNSRAQYYPTY